MTTAPEPSAYTLSEAAAVLRISYSTVKRRAKTGAIPSYTVGKCKRIPADAVRAIMRGETVTMGTVHYLDGGSP